MHLLQTTGGQVVPVSVDYGEVVGHFESPLVDTFLVPFFAIGADHPQVHHGLEQHGIRKDTRESRGPQPVHLEGRADRDSGQGREEQDHLH